MLMLKPEERYCKRLFHGMLDMREAYDSQYDENADLSDDIDNFKFNPDREEDVELFNYAFCDRVSRIYQNREEYFHGNKLLIDLYDAYSNFVFQLHMFELYRGNTMEIMGPDYEELKFDEMLVSTKAQYNLIIALSNPQNAIPDENIIVMTEQIDRMSQNIHGIGYRFMLPY